jgi:hypothetical protein
MCNINHILFYVSVNPVLYFTFSVFISVWSGRWSTVFEKPWTTDSALSSLTEGAHGSDGWGPCARRIPAWFRQPPRGTTCHGVFSSAASLPGRLCDERSPGGGFFGDAVPQGPFQGHPTRATSRESLSRTRAPFLSLDAILNELHSSVATLPWWHPTYQWTYGSYKNWIP